MTLTSRIPIVATAILACGLTAGCGASTRTLAARVVDAAGNPLAGAVFYAEAQRHEDVIGFAWCETAADGQVRDAAGRPLNIPWAAGARLAMAVFAPGKQPLVIYDAGGRVQADGLDLPLAELPPPGERWVPRVAQLAFPFENHPRLAARVAAPECAVLRAAFSEAYAPLEAGETSLRREQAKLAALRRLQTNAAATVAKPPSP